MTGISTCEFTVNFFLLRLFLSGVPADVFLFSLAPFTILDADDGFERTVVSISIYTRSEKKKSTFG